MALVENITALKLGRDVDHRSVECTDVITNTDGENFFNSTLTARQNGSYTKAFDYPQAPYSN
ncbi:MAG: hypothetical protein HT580_11250 [Dechloromonas sp.]|nr:MAG: hypothetical protein HT580_11250 [Dechloromonas sp.]